MAVLVTLLDTGEDFGIGPDAGERDKALADSVFMRASRTRRSGRVMLECREHDHSDEPELAVRRDAADGRVHGILVYLRKRYEGTPRERWEVVHFDGSAVHVATGGKSSQHQREQDEWCAAADAAGYGALQEEQIPGGGIADVLILGPTVHVDLEVQRSHQKRQSVLRRTDRNTSPGIAPLWSSDRLTDWNRDNAVPNVRTNELPEGYAPRDTWRVIGGVRQVEAEKCSARNGSVCPRLGRGRFCGRWHARSLPPDRVPRVYEIAEKFPGGGYIVLDAGRRLGRPLVTPEHRDLFVELTGGSYDPLRVPRRQQGSSDPAHRVELRAGFGAVIDRNRAQPGVQTGLDFDQVGPADPPLAEMERLAVPLAAGSGGRPMCAGGCGQFLLLTTPGRTHCERCKPGGFALITERPDRTRGDH